MAHIVKCSICECNFDRDKIEFVNMTDCYSADLKDKVRKICKKKKLEIKEGIFVQMSGPSYETNAEVNMLRGFGADAVSMSTAHDCIIANYYKMKVLGFSDHTPYFFPGSYYSSFRMRPELTQDYFDTLLKLKE